ncbi:hypothetical protein V8C43DRAFT_172358 [Trichoderma afarasin]
MIAKPLSAIRRWKLFSPLRPRRMYSCEVPARQLFFLIFFSASSKLGSFSPRSDKTFYANPLPPFPPCLALPPSMPFTAEMALNSSFASLMAEICAIVENQLPTESPQEDILQHGEDIQDVTTTFEREKDASQATGQPREEEERGSNGEEEHTKKEPKIECTPVEAETKRTWTSQWETVFPKSKAVAKNLWYAAKSRTQRLLRSSQSNSSGTTAQLSPKEQRGHHQRRIRKSQKEPEEDDWVVVADDFGILVFLDDYTCTRSAENSSEDSSV